MAADPWDVFPDAAPAAPAAPAADPWAEFADVTPPLSAAINPAEPVRDTRQLIPGAVVPPALVRAAPPATKRQWPDAPPADDPTAAWGDVFAAIPGQVKTYAAQTIEGARNRALRELQEAAPHGEAGVNVERLAADVGRSNEMLAEMQADAQRNAVPNQSWLQQGVTSALTSAPVSAAALGVGLLTRNPALAAAAMAPIASSQKFGELAAKHPEMTTQLMAAHADWQGAVEAGTELLPFDAYLKRIPGINKFFTALASELPGESIATLAQGASDFVAEQQSKGEQLSPELAWEGVSRAAEEVPATLVGSLIGTAGQSGAMSAADAAARKLTPTPPLPLEGPLPAQGVMAGGAPLAPLSSVFEQAAPRPDPFDIFADAAPVQSTEPEAAPVAPPAPIPTAAPGIVAPPEAPPTAPPVAAQQAPVPVAAPEIPVGEALPEAIRPQAERLSQQIANFAAGDPRRVELETQLSQLIQSAAVPEPAAAAAPPPVDFTAMKVPELKTLAKERGVEGAAKMKKAELVAALQATEPEEDPFANVGAAPTLEQHAERAKTDPAFREQLQGLARDVGWESVGGRVLGPQASVGAMQMEGAHEVQGRTEWLPKAPWYLARPTEHTATEYHAIIQKLLDGTPIRGKHERVAAEWIAGIATQFADAPPLLRPEDLQTEGITDPARGQEVADLTKAAILIDEDAVERATRQFEHDDAGYEAEIRRIIADSRPSIPAGETGAGAPSFEQAGAGQQAIIPGAERKERAPTPALNLEGGADLTPPPASIQPRLQLEGGVTAPPKPAGAPKSQPAPSLGGGLFAQPAPPAKAEAEPEPEAELPRRTAQGSNALELAILAEDPEAGAALGELFKDETQNLARVREGYELFARLTEDPEREDSADLDAAMQIQATLTAWLNDKTADNAMQFEMAVWDGLVQLTGEEDPDPANLLENEIFADPIEAGRLVFDSVDPQTASFDVQEFNTAAGMVEFRRKIASTFPDPGGEAVNLLAQPAKPDTTVTPEHAAAELAKQKAAAKEAGKTQDNSNRVIISLFDYTGTMAQPWKDAGYTVFTADVMTGHDLMDFGTWMGDIEELISEGYEIEGVIAQPPCTSFTNTGRQWWKTQHDVKSADMVQRKYGEWAAEHFETPLDYANTLVAVVKLFVAQSNPRFYVMENPSVTRIDEQNHLPVARLIAHPHNYGDPYTKATGLWGEFNNDLPINNVEPVKGSMMQNELRGTSTEGKRARSKTPDGFAYAFFTANHVAGEAKRAKSTPRREPQVFEHGPPDRTRVGASPEQLDAERQLAKLYAAREKKPYQTDKEAKQFETQVAKLTATIERLKKEFVAEPTPLEKAEAKLAAHDEKGPAKSSKVKRLAAEIKHREQREKLAAKVAELGGTPAAKPEPPAAPAPRPATEGLIIDSRSGFKKLLIMSCSGKKATPPYKGAPMKLETLYGPGSKMNALAKVPTEQWPDTVFLSGKLGLKDGQSLGEDYNFEMKADVADKYILDKSMRETFANTIAQFKGGEVMIAAGGEYKRVLTAWLDQLHDAHNNPDPRLEGVTITIAPSETGKMRGAIKSFATGETKAAPAAEPTTDDEFEESRDEPEPDYGAADMLTDANAPLNVKGGATRKTFRKRRGVVQPRPGPLAQTRVGEVLSSGRDQIWAMNGLDPDTVRLWPIDKQYRTARKILMDRYGFLDITKDANLNTNTARDVLQDAFVSLANMSVMLGLPDTMMSFDRKMNLQLRAGAGGALGYHQFNPVLGTHTLGVIRRNDTFAHEWGHGLDYRLWFDNHIALMKQVQEGRAQSGKTRLVGVDNTTDPLAAAWVDLLNAMYFDADKADIFYKDLQTKIANTTGSAQAKLQAQLDSFAHGHAKPTTKRRDLSSAYLEAARQADLQTGDSYWKRPTEMFARAFEAYVSYKVETFGANDTAFLGMRDYLYREGAKAQFHTMYPQTKDRVAVFDAMDKLFDAMRHTGVLGFNQPNAHAVDTSKPRDWRASLPANTRTSVQRLTHDLRSQKAWRQKQAEASKRVAKDSFERRERKVRHDQQLPQAQLSIFRNAYLATIERGESLASGVFLTVRGEGFAAARKYPWSKGIKAMNELFFTDPGSRKFSAPKFSETLRAEINRWSNRLSKIAEAYNMSEWDDIDKRALRDVLVGTRQPPTPEMEKVAARLRELLDDLHVYAERDGLKIGYTKNGYLPRLIDELAVTEDPTEFMAKAREVYNHVYDRDFPLTNTIESVQALGKLARSLQMAPQAKVFETVAADMEAAPDQQAAQLVYGNALLDLTDAHDQMRDVWTQKAAEDWYNRILGISEARHFAPESRGPSGDFMKTRSLPPAADAIMADFYITDPEMLISTYINQNVRRSIFGRFFGNATSSKGIGWKIDAMFTQMIRDGVQSDDIDQLQMGVELMVGTYKTTVTRKGRRWRSAVTAFWMTYILGNSIWSQVAEPTAIALRTGRTRDLFAAHGLVARDFLGWLKWLPQGQQERVTWLEDFAETLGVVTDAYADELMQNRFNLQHQTLADSRKMSRFFRIIGVHQHSMAMRRAAANLGLKYITREMKAYAGALDPATADPKRAKRAYQNLAELGLRPQDDELQSMIQWLDSRPSMQDLSAHPRFRDLQMAVARFGNESIMNPMVEDKPRWASQPEKAHMYGILSFTLAFQRNVLIRTAKLAKEAVKSRDAAQVAGMILPFVGLFALQVASYAAKYVLLGGGPDELEEEMSKEGPAGLPNWFWLGMTRSGFLGLTDPLFNAFYGIKYDRDLSNLAIGPVLAVPAMLGQKLGNLVARNDPDTETAEYRAVEGVWDAVIGPLAVMGILRMSPAVYPWAWVGAGAIAAVRSKRAKTAIASAFYEPPPKRKEKE